MTETLEGGRPGRDCERTLLLVPLFCFTIDQCILHASSTHLGVFPVEFALEAEHKDAPLAGGAQELPLGRMPRHGADKWSVSRVRPCGDADAASDGQGDLCDGL